MASFCSPCTNGVLLPTTSHFNIRRQTSFLSQSHTLSFNSHSNLNYPILLPKLNTKFLRNRNSHHAVPKPFTCSAQSNIFRAIQTVLKVGKDGIEAGTNLVPDVVPKPIARLSVGVLATFVSIFVLRSFVSTVFFALGVMGFVYFIYIALSKDKGPKMDTRPRSTSTDEAIEEANKIMDKYK